MTPESIDSSVGRTQLASIIENEPTTESQEQPKDRVDIDVSDACEAVIDGVDCIGSLDCVDLPCDLDPGCV